MHHLVALASSTSTVQARIDDIGSRIGELQAAIARQRQEVLALVEERERLERLLVERDGLAPALHCCGD